MMEKEWKSILNTDKHRIFSTKTQYIVTLKQSSHHLAIKDGTLGPLSDDVLKNSLRLRYTIP